MQVGLGDGSGGTTGGSDGRGTGGRDTVTETDGTGRGGSEVGRRLCSRLPTGEVIGASGCVGCAGR